jgi:excisionase family DNA binding protein
MTADTDAPMLTVADVRSRLNVSISTVRRLIRERKLPAYRVGGSLRFKPEEVAAYIDAQRIGLAVPDFMNMGTGETAGQVRSAKHRRT